VTWEGPKTGCPLLIDKKNSRLGWGCSSVVEHLPSMPQTLGLILALQKHKQNQQAWATNLVMEASINSMSGTWLISFIFIIPVVLGGGVLQYFQRFLQCIKYITLEFITLAALSHSPPLSPGTVATGIIFSFTNMCIHYLYHIQPPTPSPPPPSQLGSVFTNLGNHRPQDLQISVFITQN
jgi:hypothetical protein